MQRDQRGKIRNKTYWWRNMSLESENGVSDKMAC